MSTISEEEAKDNIPHGPYCYFGSRNPKFNNYKPCPYWDFDPKKDEQECGYCHYLKKGDWEDERGSNLLWDQVKSCYINYDYDEEEDEVQV